MKLGKSFKNFGISLPATFDEINKLVEGIEKEKRTKEEEGER